jgi:hypothetical protein
MASKPVWNATLTVFTERSLMAKQQNHFYEVTVKSHTFLEQPDFDELKALIEEFFDIDADDSTQSVEVEHVDSEFI